MRFHACTLLAACTSAMAAVALAATLQSPPPAKDDQSKSIGRQITQLNLKDASKQWSAVDLKGHKAVVVLFLGTQCPVNNSYMPRLGELHQAYSAKGVLFIGINSNVQDTTKMIAEHVKEFQVPFAVLKDADHAAADHFGARRTPEAFVLDSTRTIRYHGRIDDQFGAGFQRATANREDLAVALDEVLAGKQVSVATTEVAGCLIGRTKTAATNATISYSKHIAPIIQNRCQECHRPGQIGPMPLLNYDDVSSWSAMIQEVVSDKRMPPWHADEKHHGTFANERALAKDEYDTLLKWIDLGCPKGDGRDLPSPRKFADNWNIGTPDAIILMEQEFTVPAKAPKGGVPYMDFFVKTNFNEDKWIKAAECKPGNHTVVHHILCYAEVEGKTTGNRTSEDGVGAGLLAGYTPGDIGSVFAPGTAVKLPKGASIRFQMHYTANGVETKDRSALGLVFAKEPPNVEVRVKSIANFNFKIPPLAAAHEVREDSTFTKDAILYSLFPHMHLRGKDFKFDLLYPDGKTQTILYVPRYDFGWQAKYHFKEPLHLPKGTIMKCLAHFDNSKDNPWNPDPTATVRFGQQTWEEMMVGWIDYSYVEK